MAAPRKPIVVSFGEPNSLLRFVLASTLDASGLRRSDIAAEWARQNPTLRESSATSSLSRYFRNPDGKSPSGGPRIPSAVAEELQAAVAHLSPGATAARDYWSFRAFRDRLFPGDRVVAPLSTGAGRLTAVAGEPARNHGELFMQAAALFDEIRHARVENGGWAALGREHLDPAHRICERLLAVCAGGGPHAQHATGLLAELAAERNLWPQISAFVAEHPLGGRGVAIYTDILRRHWTDARTTAATPVVSEVLEHLRRRCFENPDNEALRAPRGLMVEALGQIDPAWSTEYAPWVEAAILDRALDRGRTARDRTFAGLVYAKRFGRGVNRAEVERLRSMFMDDPDLDPMARLGGQLHFDHVLVRDYGSDPAGSERATFYGSSEFTPWRNYAETRLDEMGQAYRSVASVLASSIDELRMDDERLVPPSVHRGMSYLLEAALFDIDAVARRIAVDTIRCAGLAGPAAAALGAVLIAPDTEGRVWIRCTALSALGLLQEHTPAVLNASAAAALNPGQSGSTELIKSALLCLGDLVSEQGSATTSEEAADEIAALTDRLVEARNADTPAWEGDADQALAYLLCEVRHMHPRIVHLAEQVDWLGYSAPFDRILRDLVRVARGEILEVYLTDPLRALDPQVIYRTDELRKLVDGSTWSGPYAEVVRKVALREEEEYIDSPAIYAAMAAGNQLTLQALIRKRNGEAVSHPEAWRDDFAELHAEGIERVSALYDVVLASYALQPVLELPMVARILSMWSEGASSQAGVDPSVLQPFEISVQQQRDLDLEDTEGPWTLFSLVAVLLAKALTKPID